jgi:hypothetical protein
LEDAAISGVEPSCDARRDGQAFHTDSTHATQAFCCMFYMSYWSVEREERGAVIKGRRKYKAAGWGWGVGGSRTKVSCSTNDTVAALYATVRCEAGCERQQERGSIGSNGRGRGRGKERVGGEGEGEEVRMEEGRGV